MSLFKFFQGVEEKQVESYNKLFESLSREYPDMAEEKLLELSCIAGLLARVAFVDFNLDEREVELIKKLIKDYNFSDLDIDSEIVSSMAIAHIKEMAGLENHLYVHPLKKSFTKEQRYEVVEMLFLVAASDGEVEAVESEEIRLIVKGLELSHQHFVAARAQVAEYIKALRK